MRCREAEAADTKSRRENERLQKLVLELETEIGRKTTASAGAKGAAAGGSDSKHAPPPLTFTPGTTFVPGSQRSVSSAIASGPKSPKLAAALASNNLIQNAIESFDALPARARGAATTTGGGGGGGGGAGIGVKPLHHPQFFIGADSKKMVGKKTVSDMQLKIAGLTQKLKVLYRVTRC